jgi:3-hydroxyisobutyrate dehydrogenase-like beta-hydroxyacid dehydrogenase
MPNGKPKIAFIGFGEAGQAIAAGLRESGVETMSAWDILFPQVVGKKLKLAAQAAGVRCANSAADAIRGVDLIISAVTAALSVEAAQAVKAHLAGTPYFLDINSVSPGRKQDTAKLLGDAGRYVDVAVLAPIYPARHQTRCCLPVRMRTRSRQCSLRSACASALPGPKPAPPPPSRWSAAS